MAKATFFTRFECSDRVRINRLKQDNKVVEPDEFDPAKDLVVHGFTHPKFDNDLNEIKLIVYDLTDKKEITRIAAVKETNKSKWTVKIPMNTLKVGHLYTLTAAQSATAANKRYGSAAITVRKA